MFEYYRLKNLMWGLHKLEYDKNIRYMRTILVYIIFGKIALTATHKSYVHFFDFDAKLYTVENVDKASKDRIYYAGLFNFIFDI